MPRLEPKEIQKELQAGELWPVYWLFGDERMKSRELLKKIKTLALGENHAASLSLSTLDASDTSAAGVVDSALSMGFGGLRMIVVRDAHLLKDTEVIAHLFGPKQKKEKLQSVCVFLSKDLDGRKKFSKKLVESAAVVSCEAVPELDRDAWVDYLAKRIGVALRPEDFAALRTLDPWNLDIVEQELSKLSLAMSTEDASQLICGQGTSDVSGELFVEAFFKRSRRHTLPYVEQISGAPEESLPLLGLLAWNTRMLAAYLVKPNLKSSFLNQRFSQWSRYWKLDEVLQLQNELTDIDFAMKQTQRSSLGSWSNLILKWTE